ncbi:uncharacterized protein LOC124171375 [Ischnura elegans]|uniref:uncharacterized protein LOC124171375 n=1 Tax=Ischnura elegans TaxID=197161 RepID=UPI001ED8B849|nr:uncharacterized protein LOC124171375 [Ischnura elegans]
MTIRKEKISCSSRSVKSQKEQQEARQVRRANRIVEKIKKWARLFAYIDILIYILLLSYLISKALQYYPGTPTLERWARLDFSGDEVDVDVTPEVRPDESEKINAESSHDGDGVARRVGEPVPWAEELLRRERERSLPNEEVTEGCKKLGADQKVGSTDDRKQFEQTAGVRFAESGSSCAESSYDGDSKGSGDLEAVPWAKEIDLFESLISRSTEEETGDYMILGADGRICSPCLDPTCVKKRFDEIAQAGIAASQMGHLKRSYGQNGTASRDGKPWPRALKCRYPQLPTFMTLPSEEEAGDYVNLEADGKEQHFGMNRIIMTGIIALVSFIAYKMAKESLLVL